MNRRGLGVLLSAVILGGCAGGTATTPAATAGIESAGPPAESPANAPAPTSEPTASPTQSPTATPAPTQSLPPSPITIAGVLKDFKAAEKKFDSFPLPKTPSLDKYLPAPSGAELKKSFAELQSSPAWAHHHERMNDFVFDNCTSGKFAAPDTTTRYFYTVTGCSTLLLAAVVTAERTREPEAIAFAQDVVGYAANLARKVPAHGYELLHLAVQELEHCLFPYAC